MIERDAAEVRAVLLHRTHAMLMDHADAVFLHKIPKHLPILRIVVVLRQDAQGGAAHGLLAPPVHMAQASARHATEPTTGFNDDGGASLFGSSDGRHHAAGRAAVDADVGVSTIGGEADSGQHGGGERARKKATAGKLARLHGYWKGGSYFPDPMNSSRLTKPSLSLSSLEKRSFASSPFDCLARYSSSVSFALPG